MHATRAGTRELAFQSSCGVVLASSRESSHPAVHPMDARRAAGAGGGYGAGYCSAGRPLAANSGYIPYV